MKWLSNILKGSKDREEHSRLRLEEIDSWLREQEDLSGFAERLDGIYGRMAKAASALSQDISDLNSAEADGSTPPKLLRSSLAARGEVAKGLISLCQKLDPPGKRDLDNATQHHWAALKGLERTATTFARAQRYVAALFPRNIQQINSHLAEISRILLELEQEIGKTRKLSEESWYIRDLSGKLQRELPRLEQLGNKISQDEVALADLKSRLLFLEEEAGRQAESEEGQRARALKEGLERDLAEKARAEKELAELMAPLAKALDRMAKQGSLSRITLQHEGVFRQLLSSPDQIRDEDISESLKELQSHLSSLGLKDRKKEKTLDHIQMLMEKRSLEAAQSRRAALEEAIGENREAIAVASREELRLKEEAVRLRKSQRSLESALDQAREDLVAGQEKAAEVEKELLERLARMTGRPIQLDLSQGR